MRKDKRLLKLFRTAADWKRDSRAVLRLVAVALRGFGGPAGLADAWVGHVRSARPGTRTALLGCEGLYRLWTIAASGNRKEHGELPNPGRQAQ